MQFELSITINRPPADVFAFLRDKERFDREEKSSVLILEKTTPGPAGVGTRHREVVQMLPFIQGDFLSVITRFDPDERLEEDFAGAGMKGHLTYLFEPIGDGTRLVQKETLIPLGMLKLLGPVIKVTLGRALEKRLGDIKQILESAANE